MATAWGSSWRTILRGIRRRRLFILLLPPVGLGLPPENAETKSKAYRLVTGPSAALP